MILELVTLIAIYITYKKLQLEPIGFFPHKQKKKPSVPETLAHRNRFTGCKVNSAIRELNEAIDHLVWLKSTPDVADTTFDSPFIFEDHNSFVIPLSPECNGSPALDHVELYNTTIVQIKLLCFQLQVMAHDKAHADVLATSKSFDHLKVLLNNKETRGCTRKMLGEIRGALEKRPR